MSALYTTKATAEAGRNGQVATNDGLLSVSLAYPKELGGNGDATNPEQLFAAGYAACFSNAILHIAREMKVALKSAPVTTEVSLHPAESGGFALGVVLSVQLDLDNDQAVEVTRAAHQVCPYSNATRGNIEVALSVNGVSLT